MEKLRGMFNDVSMESSRGNRQKVGSTGSHHKASALSMPRGRGHICPKHLAPHLREAERYPGPLGALAH